jgi:hypothetical protein
MSNYNSKPLDDNGVLLSEVNSIKFTEIMEPLKWLKLSDAEKIICQLNLCLDKISIVN